ncbi:MAG: tetratricopeptide repeat protein [Betaproteobacteria bacterium]|nr:tetratricopeptide repeat protein [Betaproteobacteria bacterium]
MRTLDLEEQEQLAEFKAWWQKFGNLVLTAITAVALVYAGTVGWQWYQRSQAGQASALYDALQKAAAEKDTKQVRDTTGAILEQFPRTIFAPLAAMISAKVHFDSGDLKTARAQLQWVIDRAPEPALQSIVKLRLAHVLVDDEATDEAIKLLDNAPAGEFASQFAALKGDILVVKGRQTEARAAYQTAIDKTDAKNSAQKERLQSKLDALGGA